MADAPDGDRRQQARSRRARVASDRGWRCGATPQRPLFLAAEDNATSRGNRRDDVTEAEQALRLALEARAGVRSAGANRSWAISA